MTIWKESFDEVKSLENSRRFNTYMAKKGGEKLFIKKVTEDTDEWSKKSIQKERQVYDEINLDGFEVPDLHDSPKDNMLCVSWVDMHDIHPSSYCTEPQANMLIKDFSNLIESMNEHQTPNVSVRWPNEGEFYYRMTSEVDFSDSEFPWMKDILSESRSRIEKYLSESTVQKSVVHGDLFNPNICFDKDGRLRGLIDWEISGYFDRMYDIAFIEAANLELISQSQSFPYKPREAVSKLRDQLDLTKFEKKRLELYKLWPYYVIIASVDKRGSEVDDYMPYKSRLSGLNSVLDLVQDTVNQIDNMNLDNPQFRRD